jgi:hypothetical protein
MILARFNNYFQNRKRLALIAGVVLSLAASSLALAEEGDPEPPIEEESATAEPILYVPGDGVIVFSLPDPDGEFTTDCSEALVPPDADGVEGVEAGEEGTEGEGDSEVGTVDATDEEGAEITTYVDGCYAVSATGPNDQTNHGQAVRAFVHALKTMDLESLGYTGPRGHLVRNAAKSDIGKDAGDDGPEDVEDLGDDSDLESDSESGKAHPGRGRAKGKNK